jgi:error-prone DNA polymerase
VFERFVSEERREPPDIDVDFEHERREQVIQWIYETCRRHRSALCSVVTCYRAKSALRDVGKALGLPEDLTKMLSSQVWGWKEGIGEKQANDLNLNATDRRLRLVFDLAQQLIGTPRCLPLFDRATAPHQLRNTSQDCLHRQGFSTSYGRRRERR